MSGGVVRSVRRYVFAAPVAQVWAALGTVDRYRAWWPWLGEFRATGLVEGDVWDCEVRPPAPYRLRVSITLGEVSAPTHVRAIVSGDVVGHAELSLAALSPAGPGPGLSPAGPGPAGPGPAGPGRRGGPDATAPACELLLDSSLEAVRRSVRLVCLVVPGLASRSHAAVLDAGARQFAGRGLGAPVSLGPHPAPG